MTDVPQLVVRVTGERRVGRHELGRRAPTEDVEPSSLRESSRHAHRQRGAVAAAAVTDRLPGARLEPAERRHAVDVVSPQRHRCRPVGCDQRQLASTSPTADVEDQHRDPGEQVDPATAGHAVRPRPAVSRPSNAADRHVRQTPTHHHDAAQTRVEQPHSLHFRRRHVTARYHFRRDVIGRRHGDGVVGGKSTSEADSSHSGSRPRHTVTTGHLDIIDHELSHRPTVTNHRIISQKLEDGLKRPSVNVDAFATLMACCYLYFYLSSQKSNQVVIRDQ